MDPQWNRLVKILANSHLFITVVWTNEWYSTYVKSKTSFANVASVMLSIIANKCGLDLHTSLPIIQKIRQNQLHHAIKMDKAFKHMKAPITHKARISTWLHPNYNKPFHLCTASPRNQFTDVLVPQTQCKQLKNIVEDEELLSIVMFLNNQTAAKE